MYLAVRVHKSSTLVVSAGREEQPSVTYVQLVNPRALCLRICLLILWVLHGTLADAPPHQGFPYALVLFDIAQCETNMQRASKKGGPLCVAILFLGSDAATGRLPKYRVKFTWEMSRNFKKKVSLHWMQKVRTKDKYDVTCTFPHVIRGVKPNVYLYGMEQFKY